jgi:hypothetical protein
VTVDSVSDRDFDRSRQEITAAATPAMVTAPTIKPAAKPKAAIATAEAEPATTTALPWAAKIVAPVQASAQ